MYCKCFLHVVGMWSLKYDIAAPANKLAAKLPGRDIDRAVPCLGCKFVWQQPTASFPRTGLGWKWEVVCYEELVEKALQQFMWTSKNAFSTWTSHWGHISNVLQFHWTLLWRRLLVPRKNKWMDRMNEAMKLCALEWLPARPARCHSQWQQSSSAHLRLQGVVMHKWNICTQGFPVPLAKACPKESFCPSAWQWLCGDGSQHASKLSAASPSQAELLSTTLLGWKAVGHNGVQHPKHAAVVSAQNLRLDHGLETKASFGLCPENENESQRLSALMHHMSLLLASWWCGCFHWVHAAPLKERHLLCQLLAK